MPKSDEEAKAKLIEFIQKGESKTDQSADIAKDKLDDAKETVMNTLDESESALSKLEENARHVPEEVAGSIQHYSQVADQKAEEVIHTMKSSANSAQAAFDDSLDAASDAVKGGAAQARFLYSRAYQRSQVNALYVLFIWRILHIDMLHIGQICQPVSFPPMLESNF